MGSGCAADCRVDKFLREAGAREVVDENAIPSPTRGEAAIGGQCHSVNCTHWCGQWLPGDGSQPSHYTGGALLNPELDQAEFFGLQSARGYLIFRWRHFEISIQVSSGF